MVTGGGENSMAGVVSWGPAIARGIPTLPLKDDDQRSVSSYAGSDLSGRSVRSLGPHSKSLISLYRLARSRPPDTQRRTNREWVREQLVRLTEGSLANRGAGGVAQHPNDQPGELTADYQYGGSTSPGIPLWTGSAAPGSGSGGPQAPPSSPGGMGIQGTNIQSAYNGVDTNTMRWRAWVGQTPNDPSVFTAQLLNIPAQQQQQLQQQQQQLQQLQQLQQQQTDLMEEVSPATYETLRNLTQHEFRRLTEQVREATGSAQHHRYRGTGFKRFYCDENGKNVPLVHRSQLAASLKSSLKVFQNRKWLPYQPTFELPEPPVQPRSRPPSCRPEPHRLNNTPVSSAVSQRSRSTSFSVRPTKLVPEPAPLSPVPRDYGRFDCLTPEIAYKLSDGVEPSSVYGERPISSLDVVPDEDENEDEDRLAKSDPTDLKSVQEGVEEIDTPPENNVQTGSQSAAPVRELADSDESDDENIPEPKVEDIEMTRIPTLHLRPEQVDNIYVPQSRNDPRRYDFDMDNVEIPVYQFKNPMPEELHNFSFKEASKSDKPWQVLSRYRPKDRSEDELISRLMEFEKLQRKTEEWENQRKCKVQGTKFKTRVLASTMMRTQPVRPARDVTKKCTVDCVQAACVGDCPSKNDPSEFPTGCVLCHQMSCSGNCNTDLYGPHSRNDSPKTEVIEDKKPPPVKSETKRSTVARYAQSTNASVARSRMPMPTRSASSAGRTRDTRSKPDVTSQSRVEDDMDKLSLEQDEEEEKLQPRHRGRAGQVPGKSMFSQRRNSLTDIAREVKLRALAKQKRVKSGRKKRPKTAM